ncbi:aBC transporter permease/ATP-binding protein [Clostridium sp. CAG:230]|nr:aBC transporter permease/ATP-binding protein [Clostridium sp. CAG:230]
MKKQSALTRLFEYAGNYKYFTMLSRILSVISAWIALVPFYYIWRIMKEVLDVAPAYDQAKGITSLGWSAVGFALLSMIIYIVALMCSHIAAFRIQANMRSAMMHKIVNLPLGFMDRDGSGKIRKIVQESSEATETYLAHQLPDRAGAIATPIGLLVLLVVFDWRLGLLSLVPVVAAFLIMSSMTGKNMEIKMKEYQNSLEEMSSEAVEYIRGIPVVKTFGQSVFSFKRFRKAIDNYEKWVISYTKDMRLPMVGYTTTINAVFAILIAAAFWFSKGTDDKTFLLNLLFYIIITPIITVTLNKIMYSSENKMLVEDALKRVDGILEREPLEQAKEPKMPKDASIVFENVSFRYKDGITDALHGVNLKIEPGEHVAFVGPSGGGKTTLASLIARFFDVTEGKLFVGGVDVREIADEKLMETVSFVFQDSKLLKMSIYDNIRRGKKDATKEQVLHALKEAQCMDIIEKMPQGIDTVIGTRGTYVSGGEAQRLSIARAMLKDAPILILDEATAFADPDNEVKVQEAFSRLSKGKTVIMVAHRLSSVTNADRICVLKDGEIVETGNHESLTKQNGIYAHMWKEYNQSIRWKVGVSDEK